MAFEVVNVSKQPFEYLKPHLEEFFAALRKLVARYPDDMTFEALIDETEQGVRTLWFVLEDGKFIAFAMTRIQAVAATGIRIAKLCDLAGDRALEASDAICEALEDWADEVEADLLDVEGRVGWGRTLAKRGYETHAVLYRKRRVREDL